MDKVLKELADVKGKLLLYVLDSFAMICFGFLTESRAQPRKKKWRRLTP